MNSSQYLLEPSFRFVAENIPPSGHHSHQRHSKGLVFDRFPTSLCFRAQYAAPSTVHLLKETLQHSTLPFFKAKVTNYRMLENVKEHSKEELFKSRALAKLEYIFNNLSVIRDGISNE